MGEDRLKVDLDDLCWAYEDAYLGNSYYLDIETGEVLFFSDNLTGTEGGPEGIEEIEDEVGDRYIALPRTSPREGYRDMEEFIETVEDEDLKEKLSIAIDGKGAFRRFKDVLNQYPDERERWFEFKGNRTEKRVRRWLEAEDIRREIDCS
ncbi:hypothetical protein AKJ65_03550 [candidate division MSBL1 archaeon SCGC-AAA259E19]|uniref:Uncharacterized protein n=1 Tax=candidate division MSBL1 archaeon SCGC-AAA259E19 TaxID=1698264 RepID=A0A133UKK6_9EURY|nr:hypothetical protein AKJ65_03550 [candidate division MSBL1 archaeon SCGC-AAA259E19]